MIWLFIFLSVALTVGFGFFAYVIREDRTAFASSTRTPAKYMSDNIDYFIIRDKKLYLKTIATALTPAVLLGVISVLTWGSTSLLLIPVIGIIFGGPLEFIVSRIARKNDGKKLEDVFDRIFGIVPADILRFVENLMKLLMMIVVIYIPIMIMFDGWGYSNLIAIPVIFAYFYKTIMHDSYAMQRKISMFASIGFTIITALAVLFTFIRPEIIGQITNGYTGQVELNSITEVAMASSFICLIVLSFRTIDNTAEVTRSAPDQTYINRMNAVNRATVVIGAMIWALITIGVANTNPALMQANVLEGLSIVMQDIFGSLYVVAITILGLSIIGTIEYDAQRVRHYVIKAFKQERGRREIKLKSTVIQSIVLIGSVFLLSILKWENELFKFIAFTNLLLICAYIATVTIYVYRIYLRRWSLIPGAGLLLSLFMTALVLVRIITFGELTTNAEVIFAISMATIITAMTYYRAHSMSTFVKLEIEDYRGF